MIKLFVTELPKTPKDCPFAQLPVVLTESDKRLIPNCQLKCNTFPSTYGFGFSFVPGQFTCSLCAGAPCKYLIAKESEQ